MDKNAKAFILNKQRLLTPGPTNLPERVRLALARDMIHHRKDDFMAIMHRVQQKLRLLFGTSGPVLPLAASGTGAMTAAVGSLLEPGEKVLVVEAGKFGERWTEIAGARGLQVERLVIDWGKAVDPAEIEARLKADPALVAVLVQLSETSTGVLHPVREIAATCRGLGRLSIVDGISAVGISPCPMDEWQIDCLLTGSQKGLMLPPGLALLALSPAAWQRAERISPDSYYFNLPAERKKLEKGQTNFTSPVNLIVGLDESLDILLGRDDKSGEASASDLEPLYARQWALTMLARTGVRALGLELLARENFAWGVTSVLLPAGVDGVELVRLAMSEHGVCLAGGQDRLKGKLVRIGHMGWVDWADILAGLHALARSLAKAGGFSASRDYLEQAMCAYHLALAGKPGEPLPGDMIHS